MNENEFTGKMLEAMRNKRLTQTTELLLINLLNRGVLWDLLKEIGVIEE